MIRHRVELTSCVASCYMNACDCVYTYTLTIIFECRSNKYIKERSSVRPIFHACIAILDAYDASGTPESACLSLSFSVSPAANQIHIRKAINKCIHSFLVYLNED